MDQNLRPWNKWYKEHHHRGTRDADQNNRLFTKFKIPLKWLWRHSNKGASHGKSRSGEDTFWSWLMDTRTFLFAGRKLFCISVSFLSFKINSYRSSSIDTVMFPPYRSTDKKVKIWDMRTFACIKTFGQHTNRVTGVRYCPDGSKLLSVSEDTSIALYEYLN